MLRFHGPRHGSFRFESSKPWSLEDDGRKTELPPAFPAKIWQVYLTAPGKATSAIDPDTLAETASWLARNPDYDYRLVGDEGARALLHGRFGDYPALVDAFEELEHTSMKSDLLRYMLMYAEGGVYSDVDTFAFKPIDAWVPEAYRGRTRVLVGIEYDRLDDPQPLWDIPHDLSFCPWTMAAAPGHPLFAAALARSVAGLHETAAAHNATTLRDLRPTTPEVMNMTGPAAWTDAVFAQLQRFEPEIVSLRNLSGLTEPRLVGDILILPINAFGMGQGHSHSRNDGTVPEEALVKHRFWGHWKSDKPSIWEAWKFWGS